MNGRDVIGGRPIYWCPGGNGYPPYCPRNTDSDEYIYCCGYGFDITVPSCCRYPVHTGLLYSLYAGVIVVFLILLFFTCWCCPFCPLARRVQEVSKRNLDFNNEVRSNRLLPEDQF
ncbi:unnamed protein product [Dracunculus medinensis]|uniref:CX domain-containing protein n=1 Tax=Dracunculus medinensis TaxID=318479 RepID=A0A0N4UGV2_DRAME|nr:unnamed protein product [Dracunculus medinensis]